MGVEEKLPSGILLTSVEKLAGYARKSSVWPATFGRELNVAVMGDKNPVALPISEIDFSEMPVHLHNIVSYQAKWDPNHEAYHKTIPICPAKLLPDIERAAKNIALKA